MFTKKQGTKRFLQVLCLFICFLLGFLVIFAVIRRIWHGYPIFLQGVIVCFVTLLIGLLILMLNKKKINKFESVVLSFLLSASVALYIMLMLSIFDRSFSLSMLGICNEFPEGITKDNVKNEMERGANGFDYAIDRHFSEQITVGNIIKINDEKYIITNRGKFLIVCFSFIFDIFAIPKEGEIQRLPAGAELPGRY